MLWAPASASSVQEAACYQHEKLGRTSDALQAETPVTTGSC